MPKQISIVPNSPHDNEQNQVIVDYDNPRLLAAARLLVEWMLTTLKEDAMSNVHSLRETNREEEIMITIRSLREADYAEWLRLRRSLWPDHDLDDLKQEMVTLWADREQQPVFVAERPEGVLCGMIEVAIHREAPGCVTDRIGYLEGWYVDADVRGQGLGKRLVETAEAWARSMGCREMASDTLIDYPVSPAAHNALGYQTVEWYFRKDL